MSVPTIADTLVILVTMACVGLNKPQTITVVLVKAEKVD